MCLMGSRVLEGLICGSFIYKCWANSSTKDYGPVRRPTVNSNLNNMVVEHHTRCGDIYAEDTTLYSKCD